MLFVLPYAPRVRGSNFIKHLSGRYDITLLALAKSEAEAKALDNSRPFCRRIVCVRQNTRSSILNCLRYLPSSLPLQVAYCYSTQFINEFQNLVATGCFDLIHVEMMRAAYVVGFLQSDVPVLFDAVDCRTAYLKQLISVHRNPYSKALAVEEFWKMKTYEPLISGQFNEVIVVADRDARAIKELGTDIYPKVVKNGVDLDYFYPPSKRKSGKEVMFIGRMGYYQNVEAVSSFCKNIWPLILKEVPEAKFHIVGMDPPKKVRKLADKNVIVTGYVSDMNRYIGDARVVVCPINIGVGLQNKILEAMAVGAPVVTTPVGLGGIDAIPGKDVEVATNPIEFAKKTVRLLKADDMAYALGANGRRYVERCHDWKKVVGDLDGIYRGLINRSSTMCLTSAVGKELSVH